jgi:hypothetical protein
MEWLETRDSALHPIGPRTLNRDEPGLGVSSAGGPGLARSFSMVPS